jgi:hypothetical protein
MKKRLLVIYLVGCLIAYPLTKQYFTLHKQKDRVWTVGDRRTTLGLCVFSWFTVVAVGGVLIIEMLDSDEPAGW